MKLDRRTFLGMTVGATQLGLLNTFGLRSRAVAGAASDGPTKLLTIYINGGVHWEHFFCPFRPDKIAARLGGTEPYPLYGPARVENFDGSGADGADEPVKPVRGPVWWNWDNPIEYGTNVDGKGYVWAAPEHALYEQAAVVHGIDQQTAAHTSGVIAATCGIAGSRFAAPAVQALVADYFLHRFPERVLPSVIAGSQLQAPQLDKPAAVAPSYVRRTDDIQWQLTDRPGHWEGFRERSSYADPGFDGMNPRDLSATILEQYSLSATRRLRGAADSAGTDARLQQLYDSYANVSQTIASDVLTRLEGTKGFEYWPASGPSWTRAGLLGWVQGLADDSDGGGNQRDVFDLALRFLKSDLTTAVATRVPNWYFDYHSDSQYFQHGYRLHGVMETLGQVLVEMQNTPIGAGGRTLLDDTLVYIYSDFGRTFFGDDHNPMTSAILVGGGIRGNQMFGGFEDEVLGIPVAIVEEDGSAVMRPPKSQDTIATVCRAFGMKPGEDFFLPGGYGIVDGIVAG